MGFDDALTKSKTDTCPTVLSDILNLIEPLEYLHIVFFRYTGTIIRNREHTFIRSLSQLKRNISTVRGIFKGIRQQIIDNFL